MLADTTVLFLANLNTRRYGELSKQTVVPFVTERGNGTDRLVTNGARSLNRKVPARKEGTRLDLALPDKGSGAEKHDQGLVTWMKFLRRGSKSQADCRSSWINDVSISDRMGSTKS
jgi:hypothetical protein